MVLCSENYSKDKHHEVHLLVVHSARLVNYCSFCYHIIVVGGCFFIYIILHIPGLLFLKTLFCFIIIINVACVMFIVFA